MPTELYQLQNTGQKLLSKSNTAALNSLVENLANITQGKQNQVAEIIKGLGALTTTVNQRSGQVSQLIDSANTLSSTLSAKDQELLTIVNNLNTVSTGLADHSTDLSNLITNVDQMATQTNTLVSGDSPQLNALLQSLHVDLTVVSQHQVDLAEGVSYLGGALKGFASIANNGATPESWANDLRQPGRPDGDVRLPRVQQRHRSGPQPGAGSGPGRQPAQFVRGRDRADARRRLQRVGRP